MENTEPSVKRRKLSHDNSERDDLPTATNSVDVHETVFPEQDAGTANNAAVVGASPSAPVNHQPEGSQTLQPLSKNQLKKLRKRQEWEAGRDFRKAKRKEKIQGRKARKREQKLEEAEQRKANGLDAQVKAVARYQKPIRLPVTFLIDCGFDDKMLDKERISLGSQLTRAYSDNSKAAFQAHLYISSWNGNLKDRFDTVLNKHYKNWKGVQFVSEDFVEAAKTAEKDMKTSKSDRLVGHFGKYNPKSQKHSQDQTTSTHIDAPVAGPDPLDTPSAVPEQSLLPSREELQEMGEIVYLTSDSPDTLTELKPYSTYIVGGLVDKNRHKGICYRTACDRGIKTAKLPIGQYMEMQSRFVLATNHVVEIMIRYLECGDWGESFMKVMPKRKGGKLRNQNSNQADPDDEDSIHKDEDEDEDENDSVPDDEVDSAKSASDGVHVEAQEEMS